MLVLAVSSAFAHLVHPDHSSSFGNTDRAFDDCFPIGLIPLSPHVSRRWSGKVVAHGIEVDRPGS